MDKYVHKNNSNGTTNLPLKEPRMFIDIVFLKKIVLIELELNTFVWVLPNHTHV